MSLFRSLISCCNVLINEPALASLLQADLLKQWGGVVPKLAQDAHAQAIDRV